MVAAGSVVFLQGRTHKAGAQTCLARLLAHDRVKELNPVLVCSEEGWLTEACEGQGVRVITREFPSSRSLLARINGNRAFARDIKKRLNGRGLAPRIVQANDHLEGLLALCLARETCAKSAVFLRSSGMTAKDYVKYHCGEFDLISAVSEKLRLRVAGWEKKTEVLVINDAIYPSEVETQKPTGESFPDKILVIGSPNADKGWVDVAEALNILEQVSSVSRLTVDFTGDMPEQGKDWFKPGRLNTKLNFIGRVEDFCGLVKSYRLVINPSRRESFGMAAIETLAAGVPLLSSRSGVMEQVIVHENMLFEPQNPHSLAAALGNLITNWGSIDFGVKEAQTNIVDRFNIDDSVDRLVSAYEGLQGG